jgi:hypothetical protein
VGAYTFHLEHIVPKSAGGSASIDNLALSCASCNLAKGARTQATDPDTGSKVGLFNPRLNVWHDHFRQESSELVSGITPTGRATVSALNMNSPSRLEARRLWRAMYLWP